MTNSKKITLLQKLLYKKEELANSGFMNSLFKSWKSELERTYSKIFGLNSYELNEFRKLQFRYFTSLPIIGDDSSMQNQKVFKRDLELTFMNIQKFIDELNDDIEDESDSKSNIEQPTETSKKSLKKIFISHSSKDLKIVEELVEILETIGLKHNQIFCTSLEGYGIDFGKNFLDNIKQELNEESLVLFVLSEHFYSSPICMCEMGATWIKSKAHIPIIIPPFTYKDIKGVIPLTQGFKINDKLQINSFKHQVEDFFKIDSSGNSAIWERKRDKILKRINNIITPSYKSL